MIEFQNERPTDAVGKRLATHLRNGKDFRPTLHYQDRSESGKRSCWCLSFSLADWSASFEVQIIHAHPIDEVSVWMYFEGDEYEVVTKPDYEHRIEQIQSHEPHPSGDPEQSLTREEAAAMIDDKVWIMPTTWFWEEVEATLHYWESAKNFLQFTIT